MNGITTVDGLEAVIDGTAPRPQPSLLPPPSVEECIANVRRCEAMVTMTSRSETDAKAAKKSAESALAFAFHQLLEAAERERAPQQESFALSDSAE